MRRCAPAMAVALILCVIAAPVLGQQWWQALGPAPISEVLYTGRVSALAVSPTDPDLYFAAGADGGVWRTTDGGQSWTPLTETGAGLPTTAIGALAMDPSNENVLYAGSGEANFANHSRYGMGIYKTTDGGQTWTHLAQETFAGRCFSRIIVSPADPQVLYAGVTQAGGFPAMAAAKGHPQAAGPVGVFKSTDGGQSWTHLTNGVPALAATDLAIDPVSPNVVYAAIGHIFGSDQNGIYKSINGGASWARIGVGSGFPSTSVGRISIAVAPSSPARLYALVTRPADAAGGGASTRGGYRSNDGGATWTSISPGNIQATYGWYLSIVSVHPANPDIVFMGGLSLVRTMTGGGGWATVTPPHVDLHAAAWDASGRLIVGDDGGVHRTSNLGNSWESINGGLGVIQFYAGLSLHPHDPAVMIGGTQDNGTNLRQGSGEGGWRHVLGGDGGWTQIHPLDPQIIFAQFQGTANLRRSTNGGVSFSSSSSGIDGADRNCFLPPYLIHPVNPSRMIYGTHRIYESADGGLTWTAVSDDLTGGTGAIRSLAMAPSDPMVVYASTNDGRVLVSSDRGRNFTLLATQVGGWPRVMRQMAVHPADPQTMYFANGAFGPQRIRRVSSALSAAPQWTDLTGTLPDVPVNTIAADLRGQTLVLYAGADDGVYRSLDVGATWRRLGCGMPRTAVIDLIVDSPRRRLIAGTQGRGAWTAPMFDPADWDQDFSVTSADISAFITSWLAALSGGDPDADFNQDGLVDSRDISAFIAAWITAITGGC